MRPRAALGSTGERSRPQYPRYPSVVGRKPQLHFSRAAARAITEQLENRVLLSITTDGRPDWVEQGPGPLTVNGSGYSQVSGAIEAIAADPTNPNRVFVGTVNGGIWRTDNAAGASPDWTPLSDHWPSLSMGCIAFDPQDPNHNTLYAGLASSSHGGPHNGPNAGPLLGIMKTIDGGNTWTELGRNVFSGQSVLKILPTSITTDTGRVVLAVTAFAGGRGVYRSADGGQTWTQVPFNQIPGGPYADGQDLVEDPGNPLRIYASMTNGVYRSEDGGVNWTNITQGIIGVTPMTYQGIRLGIGGVPDPFTGNHWIFAVVAGDGIFFSHDLGASWQEMDQPPDGSHFAAPIAVDPTHTNVIYATSDSDTHWRGLAGIAPGTQWTKVSGTGANNTQPHTDGRDWVFDADPNIMFESDDGGIYRLINPFGYVNQPQRHWESAIGNIRVTEFTSIAYDSVNHIVFGSAWDNAIPQQTIPNDQTWGIDEDFWGDGQQVAADNTSTPGASIHYSSQQNLFHFHRRTYTGPTMVTKDDGLDPIINNTGGLHYNQFEGDIYENGSLGTVSFEQTFVLNSVDPTRMLIGTSYLYESFDRGNTFNSLGGIGVNNNGHFIPINPVGPVTAYAYGNPTNADVIYIGGGGHLWLRSAGTGPPSMVANYPGTTPWGIALDPNDWRSVYVLDDAGRVWHTTDVTQAGWSQINGAGDSSTSLTRLSTDLRTIEVYSPTAVSGEECVLVGGYGGVYVTRDPRDGTLATWTKLGDNLPNAIVDDLHYNAADDLLVAGTYGRGAWTLPNAARLIMAGRPGALDPTLAAGMGKTTTSLGNATAVGNGVAIQPDGKIVVVGSIGASGIQSEDFGIARYNTDGSPDITFGSGGEVRTDFSGNDDEARAVAIEPDGKILVAGTTFINLIDTITSNIALARYNPDGSLDATFGTGGRRVVSFDALGQFIPSEGHALLIQPNGEIVVGGFARFTDTGRDFALVRLDPNGVNLDATFGAGGRVRTDFSTGDDEINALALQGDGSIDAVGDVFTAGTINFGFIRYKSDGSLDLIRSDDFAHGQDVATSIAVQTDGKIVVGGYATLPTTHRDFALVRYNADGSLDGGFGAGGKVTSDFGGGSADEGHALVLQSDGKIVLVGSTDCCNFGPDEFALARYQSDGSPDIRFGPYNNGLAVSNIAFFQHATANAAALDGDGRIIAAGSGFVPADGHEDFVVARFSPGEYPYHGTPFGPSTKIQAEDYDNGGGPDVAYYDTTTNINEASGAFQSNYRPGSGVDLETDSDGGNNVHVAYVHPGEYLAYTMNIPALASYDMLFRVASAGAGGTFHVEFDGVNTTGPIAIPNTGGFLTFDTICRTDVTFLAGRHMIRLVFDTPGASGFVGNLNWFEIAPAGPPFPGDANHDGIVGFDDLLIVARNYGKPGTLESGDFNQDGQVGFDDLVLLARNYGKMDPVCAANAAAAPASPLRKPPNLPFSPLENAGVVSPLRRFATRRHEGALSGPPCHRSQIRL